ncbi:MAG: hypothetical protein WC599_01295 [Bacteroidales bacterium]
MIRFSNTERMRLHISTTCLPQAGAQYPKYNLIQSKYKALIQGN